MKRLLVSVLNRKALVAISVTVLCWASSTSEAQTFLRGDADGSGTVSLGDFFDLSGSFGSSVGDITYDPCADFNRDGTISLGDFFELRDNFGTPPTDCPLGDINGVFCP